MPEKQQLPAVGETHPPRLTDRAYLATCRGRGITPSALDHDDDHSAAAANDPDSIGDDPYADGRGGRTAP